MSKPAFWKRRSACSFYRVNNTIQNNAIQNKTETQYLIEQDVVQVLLLHDGPVGRVAVRLQLAQLLVRYGVRNQETHPGKEIIRRNPREEKFEKKMKKK
jgi:hypothetical protein